MHGDFLCAVGENCLSYRARQTERAREIERPTYVERTQNSNTHTHTHANELTLAQRHNIHDVEMFSLFCLDTSHKCFRVCVRARARTVACVRRASSMCSRSHAASFLRRAGGERSETETTGAHVPLLVSRRARRALRRATHVRSASGGARHGWLAPLAPLRVASARIRGSSFCIGDSHYPRMHTHKHTHTTRVRSLQLV